MPISDALRARLESYPRALFDAIGKKDVSAVRAAIAGGAAIDWRPPTEFPPEDRPEPGEPRFRLLSEPRGVAVTPLGAAVRKGAVKVVEALLAAGADPRVRGQFSPLQECVVAPTAARLEILARLLAAGAPAGRTGTLAFEEVDREPLWTAVNARKPSVEAVPLLLDAGADPNLGYADPHHGRVSVLRRAAESSPEIAALLRSRGATEG